MQSKPEFVHCSFRSESVSLDRRFGPFTPNHVTQSGVLYGVGFVINFDNGSVFLWPDASG